MDVNLQILAFPFPIPGHINSLMHFCVSLVSRFTHIRVTFVSTSTNHDHTVRRRDSSAVAQTVRSSDIEVVSFPEPPGLSYHEQWVALWIKPHLETLISETLTSVVCILTDVFNGWVQDVANKLQISRAVFWTSSTRNDIIHLHVQQLVAGGFVPVDPEEPKVVDILPGISPLPSTELPLVFYKQFTSALPFFLDAASRFSEAKFALCNTFDELEPEAVAVYGEHVKSPYYTVGPCLPPAFFSTDTDWKKITSGLSEEDVRCLAWLDKQAPASVLYVAFGTLATLAARTLEEIAAGIEMSEQPFVFVKREGLMAESSPELHDFFREFEERNKEKAMVVSWAPQQVVLLHSAVGGFLTHCGWNSTLESMCAGVPMLAWPCEGEQNVNSYEVVRRWKVGLQINEASREEVSAVSEDGSTYRNIKDFVQALEALKLGQM